MDLRVLVKFDHELHNLKCIAQLGVPFPDKIIVERVFLLIISCNEIYAWDYCHQ